MSYIGNTPTQQAFTPAVDYFNGNGSTTVFTLSRPVASVAQVQAVIENVPQNPGSAFTVSGNTITFTSAPPSGTSNIYVYYTSPITQVIAPSDGSVGMSALTSTVTGAFSGYGFKNRIINGAFQIAQRSTGASATPSAGVTTYPSLDRWFIAQTGATASLFQGQTTPQTAGVYKAGYFGRNSGQTNVPANIFMGQQIESFNVYDLQGQSATISFNAFRGANAPTSLKCAVRFGTAADQSSSSGLVGGWTGYSASTASDFTVDTTVASFTKTVTVPADAREMMVLFYYTPTGTAGANEWFALENVQLEKGSTATSFDYRPYGTELALCQRYYGTTGTWYIWTAALPLPVFYKSSMRATPTISGGGAGFATSASTPEGAIVYQNTQGVVTLTFSADL